MMIRQPLVQPKLRRGDPEQVQRLIARAFTQADSAMLVGELYQALTCYTEAHALAVRQTLLEQADAAAAGAALVSALDGAAPLSRAWLDVASSSEYSEQPLIAARRALAECVLLLADGHGSFRQYDQLLSHINQAAHELSHAERLTALLLSGAISQQRAGWNAARSDWDGFEGLALSAADELLSRLVPLAPALFEAAASSSRLARRLLGRPDLEPMLLELAVGGFA